MKGVILNELLIEENEINIIEFIYQQKIENVSKVKKPKKLRQQGSIFFFSKHFYDPTFTYAYL